VNKEALAHWGSVATKTKKQTNKQTKIKSSRFPLIEYMAQIKDINVYTDFRYRIVLESRTQQNREGNELGIGLSQ